VKTAFKLVFLFAFLTLTFCRSDTKGFVKEIHVKNSPVSGDLSSIIKSIEIVPLDNDPDAYINNTGRAIFSDTLILIKNESNQKIVIFNSSGKYLKSISKRGRGPGEYQFFSDFSFNPLDKLISVYEGNKIKRYNMDGDFIDEITLDNRPSKATRLNQDLMILEKVMPTGDPKNDFYITLVDNKLKTIDARYPIKPLDGPGFGTEGQNYRMLINGKHAYFYSYFGDTVYHIDSKSIKPVYSLKYDKNIIIVSNGTGKYDTDPNDSYRQLSFFEVDDLNLLFYTYKGTGYCFAFNSLTGKSRLYNRTFSIRDVIDGKGIILINSMSLKNFFEKYDPDKLKIKNLKVLEKAIKDSENDFQCIIKIDFLQL
jgi:hypothetical protein